MGPIESHPASEPENGEEAEVATPKPEQSVPDASKPAEDPTAAVARNLLLLALTGLGLSLWFLLFTDLFSWFNSLVALSGAFAWLASLNNVLSDDRKKALQQRVEKRYLSRKWFGPVVLVFVLVSTLLVNFFGATVVVQTHWDHQDRAYSLEQGEVSGWLGDVLNREGTLGPGSERRFFLPHWSSYPTYRLKLAGLPAQDLSLRPFVPRKIRSPEDLYERPVILLRPTSGFQTWLLEKQRADETMSLSVRRAGGEPVIVNPYLGEAFWIDGDEDLEIPQRLADSWLQELREVDPNAGRRAPWLPVHPLEGIADLVPGERILLRLRNVTTQRDVTNVAIDVEHRSSRSSFPQEVKLDTP